ncbi:MAG TPA: WD40 repeat domain-containing protein [Longimicrobiaceae bacterium]|nr:WD40 repeat domain-containing protein [Longimicrobiaceae bacterium]
MSDLAPSAELSAETSRSHLQDWLAFLRAEAHVLREAPSLLFQQAANQADVTAPARRASEAIAAGRFTQPWLRLINKPAGRPACIQVLSGPGGRVVSCRFSPDGGRIGLGTDAGSVQVLDAETGRDLATIEALEGPVRRVAFGPVGDRVLCATAGRVTIQDGATGSEIASWEGLVQAPLDLANLSRIEPFAMSPDGRTVATGGRPDPSVLELRDSASGRLLQRLAGHDATVFTTAFSADGTVVLTGAEDGRVRLWESASGSEIRTVAAHDGPVSACAISGDGSLFATGGHDGAVRIWRAGTGEPAGGLATLGNAVAILLWSPDGRRLLAAARPYVTPRGPMRRATLILRAEDSVLQLLDPGGRKVATLQHSGGAIGSAAFSPDGGRRIASCAGRDAVRIWDGDTGEERAEFSGHTDEVLDVAFAPDGRRMATASADGTVRIWDAASEGERLEPAEECDFSPDGRRVVARRHETRSIRDAGTGAELRSVRSRQWWFSPDSRFLLTDRLELIDLDTGGDAGRLDLADPEGRGPRGAAVVSPTGDRAITLADPVTLWDLESGLGRAVAEEKYDRRAGFSPDGTRFWLSGTGTDEKPTTSQFDATSGALLSSAGPGLLPFRSASPDGLRLVGYGEPLDALTGAALDATPRSDYAPDGELALGGGAGFAVVDAGTGEPRARLGARDAFQGPFSPDGRLVASRGRALRIRSSESGGLVAAYVLAAEIKDHAWHPCGAGLALAASPRGLLLFALENLVRGPLAVTCRVAPADRRHGFPCPACRTWTEAREDDLGSTLPCPGCGQPIRLNPFVMLADWPPLAERWRETRWKVAR